MKLPPSYVYSVPVGEVSKQEIPPSSPTNTASHQCQTDDLKQISFINLILNQLNKILKTNFSMPNLINILLQQMHQKHNISGYMQNKSLIPSNPPFTIILYPCPDTDTMKKNNWSMWPIQKYTYKILMTKFVLNAVVFSKRTRENNRKVDKSRARKSVFWILSFSWQIFSHLWLVLWCWG